MRPSELKQQQPVPRKSTKAEESANVPAISEQLPRNKSSNILNSSTDSFYNNIFPRPKREQPGKGLLALQNRQPHEKHKSLHQQVLNSTCQNDNMMVLNSTGQLMSQVQAQTLQRRSTASSYEPSHQGKSMQVQNPFQQDYSLIQSNKSGFKQSLDQQRNNEQSDSVDQYLCASPQASKQLLSKEQQQQQQQSQQRQPQQQGKNALNLKNLVSQAIPSPSSQQQYLRKSGIGKQRQNQCYPQVQSTITAPQSQSIADCSSSHVGVNQSLPYNYPDLLKRNNTNISIIQQDTQGMMNTTVADPTLNTLELQTETQLTNTSSVVPPELGQLSQLDILQIENSILTRNILSNIHQQQQKQQHFQQPQQHQPFFGSTTNSTNNSSMVFDKNAQVTGVYNSLPSSPHSGGYHHSIGQAINSINNNNNNNCSDEKFVEIQNQLKAIEKQLKQQNRIQEKSQQHESNNNNNNNNISQLAAHQQQQQQHQVLVSNLNKRAYLLEQAIQRKKKQQPTSEISPEKQDYSIDQSASSQASLESQLKELHQSVRISQQENYKLSTEAAKFKLEIARLEGIIAQKESFQQERDKQNEIIYAQQKIMLSNYEAIKLQSEDIQANRQSLLMDLAGKEKENSMLKQEIQEKYDKIAMMSKEMKKKQEGDDEKKPKKQQNGSNMNNQDDNGDDSQLSPLVKQLKDEIQRLNQDIKQKDAEIKSKTAEITSKDELLLQANETTEKLQCQIKELEQTKSSEGIEQQKMKQQIYISEATILLLNQEIESYKTELVQVQQLCSISEAPSKYIMNGNPSGVGKQRVVAGKIAETEKQEQIVQQQLPSIHEQYQKLQVNYQELKVKEVEYEKSINDLKMVFQEESTVRKTLETELTQLKSAFSVQKNFSTNVGSASKVVEDLILKQKKENAVSVSNGQASSIDEEISLYKDIIQGLTTQLNELQAQNDQEKQQLKEEIRRLRAEKEQKANEINKLIKEITHLKKELEFSEIKETLNDREEEMTQLRNRNDELIANYQAAQEKRAKDRQQLEKDNEEYINILKKNYDCQIDKLKKEQRGDDEKIRMKERKVEEELETCKRLYAKIITEEVAQVEVIGKMLDAVNKKDQRMIRDKQELVDIAGVVERYQNSISGCSSLSMILKNSLRFNDIKKELLRSLFGKIEEDDGIEELVEDLDAKNKLAESIISLNAQQNQRVLQGKYTHGGEESQGNNNMKLIDSIVAEFTANNNNNLSDSIVKLSNNAIDNAHGLYQQDGNILNKTKLETVLESGESGLRPDTTPSQENSLQQSLKCSFTRSASPRDEKNAADLQRQLDEVNSKLVKVQRELMERQTEQEGLLMMATAEAARKKVLEDKIKMISEELDKSERGRKDLVDINKKLQQKIAQNESVKEFFEEQLKEQKMVIEQLEKETKLKVSQFKMCSSSNNLAGSVGGGNTGLQMDNSLKNSLISSSMGGDSVIDVDKLLLELQDRINENGELQQVKEQLEQKLDEEQKELVGFKEQIDDLQMEIEVLTNQLATKNEENKELKQKIQQLEQMRTAYRRNEVQGNNLLKIDNILSDQSHIISNLPIQESIERHVDLQISESFLNRENVQFHDEKDSKIPGGMKSSPEDRSEDSKLSDSQDKKEKDVLYDLKHLVKNFKE